MEKQVQRKSSEEKFTGKVEERFSGKVLGENFNENVPEKFSGKCSNDSVEKGRKISTEKFRKSSAVQRKRWGKLMKISSAEKVRKISTVQRKK